MTHFQMNLYFIVCLCMFITFSVGNCKPRHLKKSRKHGITLTLESSGTSVGKSPGNLYKITHAHDRAVIRKNGHELSSRRKSVKFKTSNKHHKRRNEDVITPRHSKIRHKPEKHNKNHLLDYFNNINLYNWKHKVQKSADQKHSNTGDVAVHAVIHKSRPESKKHNQTLARSRLVLNDDDASTGSDAESETIGLQKDGPKTSKAQIKGIRMEILGYHNDTKDVKITPTPKPSNKTTHSVKKQLNATSMPNVNKSNLPQNLANNSLLLDWFYNVSYLAAAQAVQDSKVTKATNATKHETPQWEAWSGWSECSITCGLGYGVQARYRRCQYQNQSRCHGRADEYQPCQVHRACPVTVRWTLWTAWGKCSASCDYGFHVRTRTCISNTLGVACKNQSTQVKRCRHHPCEQPVDIVRSGHWSEWGQWSSCPVTCGEGKESRTRICRRGNLKSRVHCKGKNTDQRPCILPACSSANIAELSRILEGQTTRLRCLYNKTMKVSRFYWINPHGETITRENSNLRYNVTGDSLLIQHTQRYDRGTYHCIAVSDKQRHLTADASLDVITCATGPCFNGGSCKETNISVANLNSNLLQISCVCTYGYSGLHCEKAASPVRYIVAVVISVAVFFFVVTFVVCHMKRGSFCGNKTHNDDDSSVLFEKKNVMSESPISNSNRKMSTSTPNESIQSSKKHSKKKQNQPTRSPSVIHSDDSFVEVDAEDLKVLKKKRTLNKPPPSPPRAKNTQKAELSGDSADENWYDLPNDQSTSVNRGESLDATYMTLNDISGQSTNSPGSSLRKGSIESDMDSNRKSTLHQQRGNEKYCTAIGEHIIMDRKASKDANGHRRSLMSSREKNDRQCNAKSVKFKAGPSIVIKDHHLMDKDSPTNISGEISLSCNNRSDSVYENVLSSSPTSNIMSISDGYEFPDGIQNIGNDSTLPCMDEIAYDDVFHSAPGVSTPVRQLSPSGKVAHTEGSQTEPSMLEMMDTHCRVGSMRRKPKKTTTSPNGSTASNEAAGSKDPKLSPMRRQSVSGVPTSPIVAVSRSPRINSVDNLSSSPIQIERYLQAPTPPEADTVSLDSTYSPLTSSPGSSPRYKSQNSVTKDMLPQFDNGSAE